MHPRFAKPFETLSAPLQAALLPMLGDDFQARFTPEQVATLKAATGLDDRARRRVRRHRRPARRRPRGRALRRFRSRSRFRTRSTDQSRPRPTGNRARG